MRVPADLNFGLQCGQWQGHKRLDSCIPHAAVCVNPRLASRAAQQLSHAV